MFAFPDSIGGRAQFRLWDSVQVHSLVDQQAVAACATVRSDGDHDLGQDCHRRGLQQRQAGVGRLKLLHVPVRRNHQLDTRV